MWADTKSCRDISRLFKEYLVILVYVCICNLWYSDRCMGSYSHVYSWSLQCNADFWMLVRTYSYEHVNFIAPLVRWYVWIAYQRTPFRSQVFAVCWNYNIPLLSYISLTNTNTRNFWQSWWMWCHMSALLLICGLHRHWIHKHISLTGHWINGNW